MIPEFQTWEQGKDTVLLEKSVISNSGRYYVNVQGAPEILQILEAKIGPHNENVYCEWPSKEDSQLRVFQKTPGSEFGGAAILALLGDELADLEYSRIR